jgi:addiction module HigA family antidote
MRERTRPPTHPGGILKRQYLEPLHIGITQAAEALGISRKTLSKIVNERGAITPDMALRLAQALHTTPELWINLQRTYDLWHAARQSEDWRQVHELVAVG